MDEALAREVWERAGSACEYCRIPQEFYPASFEIDHIIARQHGGLTRPNNLALSCLHCNSHKGPNIAGLDPRTNKLTRLFHPRRHKWARHFRWSGAELVGRTAIGRTTIAVLAINDTYLRGLRAILLVEGVFPPIS
ncbi:MAG TPA: HNH endonuclease signature motif containing protein [Gemmataceae bacterium]|nr:HNH endonuclease signature motif containing protein [Gemmataceae bacterium]